MQCNLSNIRIKPNKKADPGTPAVRIDRRYNIDGGLTYLLLRTVVGGRNPLVNHRINTRITDPNLLTTITETLTP